MVLPVSGLLRFGVSRLRRLEAIFAWTGRIDKGAIERCVGWAKARLRRAHLRVHAENGGHASVSACRETADASRFAHPTFCARNDEDMRRRSRGAISRPSHGIRRPSRREGAGNAGRWPHPQPRLQWKKQTSVVTTGKTERSALPAQWFLRLLRALPGVSGLLASVACGIITRKLDPSVEGTGPHGLTVRTRTARLAAQARPSHPASRLVTMAERPSCRGGTARVRPNVPYFVKVIIFIGRAGHSALFLDDRRGVLPVGLWRQHSLHATGSTNAPSEADAPLSHEPSYGCSSGVHVRMTVKGRQSPPR